MIYTMENEFLTVTADNVIGELKSITSKKTGKEYLWNGDPKHWNGRAPMLFPVIGKLFSGCIRVDGMEYLMAAHGFLRTSTLDVVEHTSDRIVFQLTDSEETLKQYPYHFKCKISYVLNGNNVDNIIAVENTDSKTIYFSVGGHPAFMCPINEGESFTDYYLEFSENETVPTMLVNSDIFFIHETAPFLKNERIIDLHYDLFNRDVFAFENLKSEFVCLKSKKNDNYIRVSIKDFPYVTFWTKRNAPYICIEPWFGHADFEGFQGDISEKAGIVSLDVGNTFRCNFNMEICE